MAKRRKNPKTKRDRKYTMRFFGPGFGVSAVVTIKIDASLGGSGLGGTIGQRDKALKKIGNEISKQVGKGTGYGIPIPYEVVQEF